MMDLRLRVPETALLALIDEDRVLVPPAVLPVQRDADALRFREALVGPVAPVELCEERAPHLVPHLEADHPDVPRAERVGIDDEVRIAVEHAEGRAVPAPAQELDRKSTRLNSSHVSIS